MKRIIKLIEEVILLHLSEMTLRLKAFNGEYVKKEYYDEVVKCYQELLDECVK